LKGQAELAAEVRVEKKRAKMEEERYMIGGFQKDGLFLANMIWGPVFE